MEKFYLLTFNDDYGDEHDVPALECMTEKEYNEWLEKPSGELNPNYIEEKENWDEYERAHKAFYEELKEKGLYNKPMKDFTKDEKIWYDSNKIEYKSSRGAPKKVNPSYLNARLGNGGDGFDESYQHLYLMKEFVEAGNVKVQEVDEAFYIIFKRVGLSSLSLCNIFEDLN